MRFASLGSGSQGNATIVEARDGETVTRVMIDCGFGARELGVRLGRLGLALEDIHAVLVTHEHSDHIAGAFRYALRQNIPVYLTAGTLAEAPRGRHALPELRIIDSHEVFQHGCIEILPFPVPHDAREPVQFVLSDGAHRIGVVTDLGASTPHVERCLNKLDALVLECNHDLDMLARGPYPESLKRRVGGRFGHLDNAASARLVQAIDCSKLQHLVAAHLSEQNNHPDLVRSALSGALGCEAGWIAIANQDEGLPWYEVHTL